MLRKILSHPLTEGLDIDDPQYTSLKKRVIESKPFLCKLYKEWYGRIADDVPDGDAPALEIGSGASRMSEYIDRLITSDFLDTPGLDIVLDGRCLPYKSESLRAIVMTNVLHHIPDVDAFFAESHRCLQKRGAIIMIEPWITIWSKFIYTYFHHEHLDTNTEKWGFEETGPLSGANEALPSIIFERDRKRFESKFPFLNIQTVEPIMPLSYILSGGFSLRSMAPGWSYKMVRGLENLLRPLNKIIGMFAYIAIVKKQN